MSGLLLSGSIKIGRSAQHAPALPAGAFVIMSKNIIGITNIQNNYTITK
nr:MAG TPA: hypothetical protein [Caudoviricetes sp.]